MAKYSRGDLLLLAYGNGTQAAIVVSVTARGTINVLRLYYAGTTSQVARPSKLKSDDARILAGQLGALDPRAAFLRSCLPPVTGYPLA
jgi:hypothetical protein